MKVHVDAELCDASGKCAKLCPELFTLDEFGFASVAGDGSVPPALERAVRKAQSACPTAAIEVD